MKQSSESSDAWYLISENKKRNRASKINRIVLLLLLILCLSLYFMWYFKNYAVRLCFDIPIDKNISSSPVCSGIPDIKKIDCYPDAPVTEIECSNRGCCYSVPSRSILETILPPLNVPYCYYPLNYKGYVINDVKRSSQRINVALERTQPSGFPKDVTNLKLLVTYIDDHILRIKVIKFFHRIDLIKRLSVNTLNLSQIKFC